MSATTVPTTEQLDALLAAWHETAEQARTAFHELQAKAISTVQFSATVRASGAAFDAWQEAQRQRLHHLYPHDPVFKPRKG